MSTLFETKQTKINSIRPLENNFLKIVNTIANSPKRLYFKGKLPEKHTPTVAIVGTRKPTNYGKEVTYQIANNLAARGVIIISGLALGVDAIAHQATLDAGGITIAILGNGIDTVYPATNQNLAKNILAKDGAIISEYEPGIEARDFQFLSLNRIVSGLSDAIIITEAAIRSGTMSTAARALEQGKEVFVVPGNITSPLSAGCNRLIKQGAHPITCADDVLEVIAPELLKKQSITPLGQTPLESKIIKLIQAGVRNGEELQIRSNANISEFSQTITLMEISGTIRALGGNQWTLY